MKSDERLDRLRSRKGAVRMSEIPPEVLSALNRGEIETRTLVEWLAIDMPTLLRAAAVDVGLESEAERLGVTADALASLGVTKRIEGIGRALHDLLTQRPDRQETFARVASHPSDMVRAWAASAVRADPDLPLPTRLEIVKRFAADQAMSVRELAWDSYRPHVAAQLELGLELLRPWVEDADANVRRCAVEGTRPRGVWTFHIDALKADPELGLPLLEPVRSDSSDYVRKAIANWLNDASKSEPGWVTEVCARWTEESPTKETAWIVNRALRTIRKG